VTKSPAKRDSLGARGTGTDGARYPCDSAYRRGESPAGRGDTVTTTEPSLCRVASTRVGCRGRGDRAHRRRRARGGGVRSRPSRRGYRTLDIARDGWSSPLSSTNELRHITSTWGRVRALWARNRGGVLGGGGKSNGGSTISRPFACRPEGTNRASSVCRSAGHASRTRAEHLRPWERDSRSGRKAAVTPVPARVPDEGPGVLSAERLWLWDLKRPAWQRRRWARRRTAALVAASSLIASAAVAYALLKAREVYDARVGGLTATVLSPFLPREGETVQRATPSSHSRPVDGRTAKGPATHQGAPR
jgi:hypothetical protein